MINVGLLLKDPTCGTLLTWREDDFRTGWHIPGGIIRLYELTSSAQAKSLGWN
jgi:hypothetical protein